MKITDLSNPLNINMQRILQKETNETESFQEVLKKMESSKDMERLKSACKDFEAIFINMMMKSMRATIPEGGLMEKSHAREIFEGMLDEELSKEMSKADGIGIAKLLYEQLSKNIKE